MNAPQKTSLSLVNGHWSDSFSIEDRGLAYGDGLFETVRFRSGFTPLWPLHWQRLQHGAQVLGLDISPRLVESWLLQAVQRATDAGIDSGIIKIIATRGRGGSGYIPPSDQETTVAVIVRAIGTADNAAPVRLKTCSYRLSHNPTLAGIKHLNRLEQVLAARSITLAPGEQGLLLDCEGYIIETLHHNLFLIKDQVLRTPHLGNCGVAGTLRRAILEDFAPSLELETRVEKLDQKDLSEADEVFICNAVRGITPITEWQNSHWAIGGVTQLLAGHIAAQWDHFYDC